jgi:flagellar FliL protein
VAFRGKPAKENLVQRKIEEPNQGKKQVFTDIGQIRVSTADSQPGTVILFVSFMYPPEDKAFSEELTLKARAFREIIFNYIGSFSCDELRGQSEEHIKAELLLRINAILRLGQIETLYFSDFMIVQSTTPP